MSENAVTSPGPAGRFAKLLSPETTPTVVYNLPTVWRCLHFLTALGLIAIGLWRLSAATEGLVVTRERVGSTPVTVFRPEAGPPGPAIVIAHGFAGSQPLMQPFAVTLARNGYLAVTFDFPGHGRNPAPLPGGLAERDARNRALADSLAQVVGFAGALAGADGRVALLGHSMAADAVVRFAAAHPEVAATVAVSLFLSGEIAPDRPRNLLVIDGALEPAALIDEGRRVVGRAAGGTAAEDVTYGSFAAGTARRLVLADGVEHIGVLYSGESLAAALAWLDAAFGRQSAGFIDARGPWLGVLYLGLIALAWPLARLLPRVAPAPLGAGFGRRKLLAVAIVPALLTPLVLWKLPGGWLPILLGDYLALHFGVYGLLTAAGLWVAGGLRTAAPDSWRTLALAALAAAAYATFALGLPADRFVVGFVPGAERLPLLAAMLAGTLPYFTADEWLTRGPGAPRGAYAATKILFLASLAAAIALNLAALFFLAIIVPAILAFFVVYGLFSRWIYQRTGHPFAGAAANAFAFAWAIAVTFPVVSR
jgi:predicted alpha/beta-hydrolase family hydrolase